MDLTPARARNNFKLDLSHKNWDDLRGFLKDFFKIVDRTARHAESALAYEYIIGSRGKNTEIRSNNENSSRPPTAASSGDLGQHQSSGVGQHGRTGQALGKKYFNYVEEECESSQQTLQASLDMELDSMQRDQEA